jgi:trehalose synthase
VRCRIRSSRSLWEIWNINSTAGGGGVEARWVVIEGSPEFFAVTKRIHNRLPGSVGDGGPLDDHARRVYEQTLAGNASEFDSRVREGDVVIVHDPQPGR